MEDLSEYKEILSLFEDINIVKESLNGSYTLELTENSTSSVGVINTFTSDDSSYITTYNPQGVTLNLYDSFTVAPTLYTNTRIINAQNEPKNTVDKIKELILSLEDNKDEQTQKAVKHLTFAKVYLEKMVLDKLNEKL